MLLWKIADSLQIHPDLLVNFEFCKITMTESFVCNVNWEIFYISTGIIGGIPVLPVAIWCSYKHIKSNLSTTKSKVKSSKLLFRLSICLYLCTILGSIFTFASRVLGCYISLNLWNMLWYLSVMCWLCQLFLFILLLFSRCVISISVNQSVSCHSIKSPQMHDKQSENCIPWIKL